MKVLRIYPEGGSRFVRVFVHDSHAAMRRHWQDHRVPFNGGSWARRQAYCTEVHRWIPRGRGHRRDPCVAEVHLNRRKLWSEIVTHEFFHATLAWGRRIGFDWRRLGPGADPVNDDEERLAYVHGALCGEFVAWASRSGLYPD